MLLGFKLKALIGLLILLEACLRKEKRKRKLGKNSKPQNMPFRENCLESRFLFNKQWSIELINHEHITADFVVAAADNCSSRAWEY